MTPLSDASVVIIGAGSGVGKATALALASGTGRVFAAGRDREKLERLSAEAGGKIEVRPLDATNRQAIDGLLAESDPDVVILAAGARAKLGLVTEHTWETFSAPWNNDTKMAFELGQAAVHRPLRPGSTVILVSSGAGLGGSPLSGGYAGAKRMQMFLASYLQRAADAGKLGIRFVAVVPKQLIVGTATADAVSEAYAKLGGISAEAFMQRFGTPLTVTMVAERILAIARGEIGQDATVLGLTGDGTEVL